MDGTALTGVAGVPETAISETLLARLPANDFPAPWECVCEAVLWFGRGGPAARQALPPALRDRSPALAVVGAMVRYLETPVGPYDEVIGMVASRTGTRPWVSVAFMAVDSEPSLVGGRTNWAMPKTLSSSFEGRIANRATVEAAGAQQARWRVSARPAVLGPTLPVRAKGRTRQEFPGGRVANGVLHARGRLEPAVVTVEVDSDGPLPGWLRPGRHLGAVVEKATFTLSEPEF